MVVVVEAKEMMSRKAIESEEHEIICVTKVRPFMKEESLQIDVEGYHEIVEKAKDDFRLLVQIN